MFEGMLAIEVSMDGTIINLKQFIDGLVGSYETKGILKSFFTNKTDILIFLKNNMDVLFLFIAFGVISLTMLKAVPNYMNEYILNIPYILIFRKIIEIEYH